ncbi:MAG: DUF4870 domain-containing protein [Candidatus Omnitrophica bacterium]|nr:DUF4870 domain-containing protein [Candidatus Omnitrophota bacterium]MDD5592818.1 DUF4870 domain-containing protein [Candidatus Omnitrophota bacterium]
MPEKDLGKTSIGMNANIAAVLSYLLGFASGIIFYLLEKENKFVRFHAMQSIVTFGFLWVLSFVIMVVPSLGWVIARFIYLIEVILWVILMFKAYQGEYFKLPVAGDIAEKNS